MIFEELHNLINQLADIQRLAHDYDAAIAHPTYIFIFEIYTCDRISNRQLYMVNRNRKIFPNKIMGISTDITHMTHKLYASFSRHRLRLLTTMYHLLS